MEIAWRLYGDRVETYVDMRLNASLSPLRLHTGLGGSPRALRAWPSAWPSPSGPPGRQRSPRARVGPEDAFCGAVCAERLEGSSGALAGGGADTDNARRSGPVTVTLPGDRRTWRERDGLVLLGWRGSRGRDGGDRLRPVPGKPCAAAAADVGPASEGRGEAAAPQRRDPGRTPAAYSRSPGRSARSPVLAPARVAGPGRQAWRAEGAPLKP